MHDVQPNHRERAKLPVLIRWRSASTPGMCNPKPLCVLKGPCVDLSPVAVLWAVQYTQQVVRKAPVRELRMQDILSESYTEHLDTARDWLKGQGVGGPIGFAPHEATLVSVVEHGPQVVVTHALTLSGAEQDHIVVVGFYIPHDGNCTTVINHMDGCITVDNADVLFGGPQQG